MHVIMISYFIFITKFISLTKYFILNELIYNIQESSAFK